MELIEILLSLPIWVDIGVSVFIFVFFLLLRKLFTKYVFRLIIRMSKKSPTALFTNVFLAFEKPLRWFFVFLGLYLAINALPYEHGFEARITQMYRTLIIVLITSGLYNLASTSSPIFEKVGKKLHLEVDKILIPVLSKLLRFLIVAISLSVIAQEWNFDINGFVAGLGLGGLALAFAAQEMIEDFFGGIIIMTEKPFTIGDWIKTKDVEGTVEEISFRSTRIRAFRQAVVTVPNSTLANTAILNWTKMGKRQITFHLGVTKSTSKAKLEAVIKEIELTLRSHPDIHQETIFVRFDGFNQNSLDIFLYFFTKTTVWGEYLGVKEDINLRILEILQKEGVTVAFPTRTLYVESKPQKKEVVTEKEVNLN
ncbi:mechanosensitive ion channel family protein [Anaerobacillus alkaliphilus]|uniref:Mechanosensitive ion channel family protein n=1 Tax=Anaerobacillus alkaliphilus TaxID=1548597 RepID=A0A4V1LG55_9BACI|nr:mechanosensitive ion channel family protein [Anaerobacillus alkaliphilus]RXI98584.1 mechanosensitive ion channel family protein [Anaerobacillus alkaliphilus]